MNRRMTDEAIRDTIELISQMGEGHLGRHPDSGYFHMGGYTVFYDENGYMVRDRECIQDMRKAG